MLSGPEKDRRRDMFGRSLKASEPSPGALTPAPDRSGEQRPRAVPSGLLPWLLPLAVVLIIVAGVAAPSDVSVPLGLVLIAGLVWMLLRSNRGQDFPKIYGMTRNDRFLKGQDNYEMTRNDRFLKGRDNGKMTRGDRDHRSD